MKEQFFIDIEVSDSLSKTLQHLIDTKRAETGSQNVYIQNVIPSGDKRFTVILEVLQEIY
ncbi:hypothetical protein [Rossellomorea aquimaris]|jgi:hypothetical protein|uniref:hypothetical protein n=1 Tax=Rossellomorea aquimaris TaxID=189382 RepID=UPI0011E8B1BD|nr:hypothetical protein [Rossellomorea aquimaris]TYS91490.1 hypothetical protein FZC88_04910 [Rossellomorea aquimaris]